MVSALPPPSRMLALFRSICPSVTPRSTSAGTALSAYTSRPAAKSEASASNTALRSTPATVRYKVLLATAALAATLSDSCTVTRSVWPS